MIILTHPWIGDYLYVEWNWYAGFKFWSSLLCSLCTNAFGKGHAFIFPLLWVQYQSRKNSVALGGSQCRRTIAELVSCWYLQGKRRLKNKLNRNQKQWRGILCHIMVTHVAGVVTHSTGLPFPLYSYGNTKKRTLAYVQPMIAIVITQVCDTLHYLIFFKDRWIPTTKFLSNFF